MQPTTHAQTHQHISFDNFLFFAPPLELNSDNAYRTLCYRNGADITFTEMIRLQGLVKHNKATWSRLEVYDDTPTIVQLLVNRETDLEKFLTEFKPFNGFLGFNMNMGCPSPDVIKLGLGCAGMKRIAKTQRLIDIFHKYGYNISIKIRLGMNGYEREKKAYLNIIKNTTPDFFIVHGRDGKQTYDDPADFSIYEECVATGKIIVANGDISKIEQIDFLKKVGVKGALIGRAAIYNPAIFNLLKGKETKNAIELKAQYMILAKAYNSSQRYITNISTRIGRSIKDPELKFLGAQQG